ERGRANAALVTLLAGVLRVGKGDVAIVRGATSRTKVVAIEGLGHEEVLRRLATAGQPLDMGEGIPR
ncbi:MAG: DUF167 domain-containing protein, partial [Chloroflexota bacterium]